MNHECLNYFYLVLLNPIINNKKLYSGTNAANYNNITLIMNCSPFSS